MAKDLKWWSTLQALPRPVKALLTCAAGIMAMVVLGRLDGPPQPEIQHKAMDGIAFADAGASAPPALPSPPKPHYAVKDGQRYSYERRVSFSDAYNGNPASPLMTVVYAGLVNGEHQLLILDDRFFVDAKPEYLITAAQCMSGCEFLKINTYHRTQLDSTQTVRAVAGMILVAALEDARNGLLERFSFRTNTDRRLAYLGCYETTCSLAGYVTPPPKPRK